ncbi:hypothetical protein [Pontiella sulfatireligans]|uniref:Uncharacterized protein n=1 Tax=Pontiella sulfatireligans TaxID=2750658 RepID=A0A6C2UFZ2_9BACT|nr:hypothetical protein [Pontiella sulfatireligans]VGO19075.1 hypothetical protein SCARR_01131 [Pontiella sulfatireligans]
MENTKLTLIRLIAAVLVVGSLSTQAALLAYEGFDSTGDVQVQNVISSVGFTNNSDLTSYRMRTYNSAGLSYEDGNGNTLDVMGQYGGMNSLVGGTKNLQMELTGGAISSGTVYMSFLFDADNATGGFNAGLLSGAVGTASSMGSVMQAMVRATSTGWGNFGVPSGIDDVGGPTNAGLHFVVSEVDLDAGTMTTYFDPSDLTDVVGNASHTVVSAGATFSPITHFGFSLGANIGYVDEVRIGTTLADVAPVAPVLYAYEGFDAVGNIRIRDMISGEGFTNNYDLTSYRMRTYDSTGLSYTDGLGNTLDVMGQYGGMDGLVSGTKNLQLELTGGAISSGTVYMSFLFDADNATGGFNAGLLSGAVGVSSSMGSVMQAMVRATSTGWGNYGNTSGINDMGGPTTAGLHFVVSEVNLDAGTMTTYFDPTDLSDVAGSASHTVASSGATFSPITHFGFSLGANIGYVDEIRIGDAMEAVIPYNQLSGILGISDDFDTDAQTYSNWVSVGSVVTRVQYDGGLKLNTQDATPQNEAIGLTLVGTMVPGEEIVFSGSVYNDGDREGSYIVQLWNLTEDTLLEESEYIIKASDDVAYVPVDFNVRFVARYRDLGDAVQVRLVEMADQPSRDIFLDHFSVTGGNFDATPSDLSAPPGATFPWGDQFPFGFYSTSEADSDYVLAHGATVLGPYYGSAQPASLTLAASKDANYFYKVTPECMQGVNAAVFDTPGYVLPSDATIVADTLEAIKDVKYSKKVVMWDLGPEELRPWRVAEMHYLNVASSALRANDPYGRPIFMYEPGNRTVDSLSKTLPFLDLCGKGTYLPTDGNDRKYNRIWVRWSMEQEINAIAAVKTNAVPLIVLWMAADALPGEEHLIETWCRHDTYMGLIMGGKGVSIWSGFRNRTGFQNDFQAYLDGYLTVADDLNNDRNLAPVFLYGVTVAGVSSAVTSGPTELYEPEQGMTYPSITYTMRDYFGQQYLFMVNSATQNVSVTFSGVPDTPRTDLFEEMEYAASGGSFSIDLAPLQVAGFRFDGYEAWRDQHFTQPEIGAGLADPGADPDGDGHDNRDEFDAGTDPNNGDDYFHATIEPLSAGMDLVFSTSSNRFYDVDYSTNLIGGNWLSMLGNEQGTGDDLSVEDTRQFPAAYYRVRVSRP